MRDGVFEDGVVGEVRGGHYVGYVAVDEDVAGLEAEEGRFGDAGVGASEPDWLGMLANVVLLVMVGVGEDGAEREGGRNLRIDGLCPVASLGKKSGF